MTPSTTVPASPRRERSPIYGFLDRIPGGLMVVPLLLGAIFAATPLVDMLGENNFSAAMLRDGALPLMALVIFSTGMQLTPRRILPVAGTAGAILLGKTIVPGVIVIALGHFVGLEGVFGLSILAMLACFDNSNGGIWIAFTSKYGDRNDRSAYIASAINDGPFFTMLFIGSAGFGQIPLDDFALAIVPLLLGIIAGNLDHPWARVMEPIPNMVIPFFAFCLGTGIDLVAILQGGLSGIVLGLLVTPFTGGTTYLAYRFLLRKGKRSGIGFVAGTTAGNSIITPSIIAAADPRFVEFQSVATVQVATAVLISSITAPIVASWVLRRNGELRNPVEEEREPEAAVESRSPAGEPRG
jgi:2-keto-3-deoxygluconate permease